MYTFVFAWRLSANDSYKNQWINTRNMELKKILRMMWEVKQLFRCSDARRLPLDSGIQWFWQEFLRRKMSFFLKLTICKYSFGQLKNYFQNNRTSTLSKSNKKTIENLINNCIFHAYICFNLKDMLSFRRANRHCARINVCVCVLWLVSMCTFRLNKLTDYLFDR